MPDLRKAIESLDFGGSIRFDEPMSAHTSFRIGGSADAFLTPSTETDVAAVVGLAGSVPLFILGAGANILVSDEGIRGIVLDMSGLDGYRIDGTLIVAGAGFDISELSRRASEEQLSGMEFIYGMPGSVGGSVWMNARCYGRSVSDILEYADVIDETGRTRRVRPPQSAFGYKVSPFQRERWVIVAAGFRLMEGEHTEITKMMTANKDDRERKGHFAAPSAGSVFKNSRAFGEPSGKIIDSLGLRGKRIGDAAVSDAHANIIINRGAAKAADILALIRLIEKTVAEKFGFKLEREIRLVGDWEEPQ